MATTNRELVQAAINNKSVKYVTVDRLKSAHATVAIVEAVAGMWVSVGHFVPRAIVYFDDNTYITSMSRYVIATIVALADDPIHIDGGFGVVINRNVKFRWLSTLDDNGKTYDVLTMTVGYE